MDGARAFTKKVKYISKMYFHGIFQGGWSFFSAGMQHPGEVLWRSPRGPNVRDLEGTLWGPAKKLMIWWKKCFLDGIVFVLLIYCCFLLEKQIFKSCKWGRPWDVYGTQLRDVPGTKWWDVLGTSTGRRSYMFLKFNSEIY